MKKIILLMIPLIVIAAFSFYKTASFKVSGKVTIGSGEGLGAVTVTEKGKTNTVVTDKNGYYTINISDGKQTLVFDHPGYAVAERKVNNKNLVNVDITQASVTDIDLPHPPAPPPPPEIAQVQFESISDKACISVGTVEYSAQYFASPAKDDIGYNTEDYDHITENSFLRSADNPLSTFSIDVDAASYSNVRRMLKDGQLPPAGAVRIEEMINYFSYNYPAPKNDDPFSFSTEMSVAPWNPDHRLVMIGMQGKKISAEKLPASNLVFLIDVSGSMSDANKLGLVKSSMKLLTDQLRPQDKVSIVVYAGAAGLVLPPTSGADKTTIKDALERLEAGGSTAGGDGIELAYATARKNFMQSGNNRVILCTDGDFNVGASSDDDMERLIEKERRSGVFLTVLGYGMGNYKDNKMQKLADKGNGNHAYIDDISEAKKVLVNEFGGTLFTIAKDVKLQVEFNPALVQGYRLVGYENRMLNKEDFNDDKKDAGDMGSGHTVTAIYEIIPVGVKSSYLKEVDKLKYSNNTATLGAPVNTDELMNIKFRYKAPDGDVSKLLVHPVKNRQLSFAEASENFRFAAAVAQFGLLLRNSEFKAGASYQSVLFLAKTALSNDKEGYKKEFVQLVESAQLLAKGKKDRKEELAGIE